LSILLPNILCLKVGEYLLVIARYLKETAMGSVVMVV